MPGRSPEETAPERMKARPDSAGPPASSVYLMMPVTAASPMGMRIHPSSACTCM